MPTYLGEVSPVGKLTLKVIRRTDPVARIAQAAALEREKQVRQDCWDMRIWKVKNFFRMLVTGEHFVPLVAKAATLLPGVSCMYGKLTLKVTKGDGQVLDYGLAGYHLITTAGKNYVASTFDNTAEPELFKFHGYGTGTTAAAIGDTALQTEETTQYATDNVRPTGSQNHATNTYTTVGTYSPDSGGTRAITEWGLLTQAATGGGTLLDHQVFSAVNLVASSDSLQTTYVLTIS